MPTMSQDRVTTIPMTVKSTMSLSDIRDKMEEMKPDLATLKGGWASTCNENSNLRIPGGAPPESTPELTEGHKYLPDLLSARFYYWDPIPYGLEALDGVSLDSARKLNAIDVVITRVTDEKIGLLFSTRTSSYLFRREGIVASLEGILDGGGDVRIDRKVSHLKLDDPDIFLWLMVQLRDNPQITPEINLDTVDALSSQDASYRRSNLESGIDFSRPNFLTSVAESELLGPMLLKILHSLDERRQSYEFRLFYDGGFEISKNGFHDEVIYEDTAHMKDVSYRLAFQIIPAINHAYTADSSNWDAQKPIVIEKAMEDLSERYRELRKGLSRFIDSGSDE